MCVCREQRSDYWTKEKLAQRHWEFLYDQLSAVGELVVHSENAKLNKKSTEAFTRIRTALGHAEEIAEELIPIISLAGFYKEHAQHARLVTVYPEAEVVRDALPWPLVSVYCDTFANEALPATCNESIRDKARTFYARAPAQWPPARSASLGHLRAQRPATLLRMRR